MPLLEHEAQRIAEALDDYEGVSVVDMGGADTSGYWLVVTDRFSRQREVSSQLDYWDFILGHAVGRPADAATSTETDSALVPAAQAASSVAEATA